MFSYALNRKLNSDCGKESVCMDNGKMCRSRMQFISDILKD
jgi:hypothetical protein